MSKIDDLQRDFRKAFIEAKGSTLSAERAGIAAVVRALRREIWTRIGCVETSDVINEILGDAGEKVAGGPRPEAMGSTPLATDPVYTGGMNDLCVTAPAPTVGQRLIKAAKEAAAIARGEATAPAPAVCDIKELVKRLDENWGRRRIGDMSCLLADAADALEAMAGEVENLKHDIARHMTIANEAAAERDRMKAALVGIIDFIASEEWREAHTALEQIVNRIHKALGGDVMEDRSALEAKP